MFIYEPTISLEELLKERTIIIKYIVQSYRVFENLYNLRTVSMLIQEHVHSHKSMDIQELKKLVADDIEILTTYKK